MTEAAPDPRPYADAALAYLRAGWDGVIPLPARRKANPPAGFTGDRGAWPSYADVHAWVDGPEGSGNIALRLPLDVVGLDVDAYDGKPGDQTLADAEQAWGALPPTWRTTSRDDGMSGIRLYRVPEGLAWPGELGPAAEVIQHAHRYAVVWPSVHPEGRTYRWITPNGLPSTVVPTADELPVLPGPWVTGLTGGQLWTSPDRADLDLGEVADWINSRQGDHVCRRMTSALATATADLTVGSSHTAARLGTLRLVRLAEQGHQGVSVALTQLRSSFLADITRPTRAGTVRDDRTAGAEWASLLAGAVSLVAAAPSDFVDGDPCDNPFAGLTAAVRPEVAQVPTGGAQAPQETGQARERTSWWPRDLTAVVSGVESEPSPTILVRSDGHQLFYAGKVNGLIGESESGKTWVALLAVCQELVAGRPVVYLDFEDTAAGIVSRLRALGVNESRLELLRYVSPDESLHAAAAADLSETLTDATPSLVVLDGFNAAMTLLGMELESNTDATRFAQTLLRPMTATGAGAVTIDHVPKNKEARGKGGIGAQAKRAMTTGCALAVEVVTPFGRGMTGRLRLTVDKDRPGHVRAVSAAAKHAGNAVLSSFADGSVDVVVEAPDLRPESERGPFEPTGLMEKVSRFLESVTDSDQGVSMKAIEQEVTGKAAYVRRAVDVLVEKGLVSREAGSRGAVLHRLLEPYREGGEEPW